MTNMIIPKDCEAMKDLTDSISRYQKLDTVINGESVQARISSEILREAQALIDKYKG